jgi:hypothetical protein
MRVAVTVEEIILENDGGYDVESVAVTCSRCGETVEIYGTRTQASDAAGMRNAKRTNFYVCKDSRSLPDRTPDRRSKFLQI